MKTTAVGWRIEGGHDGRKPQELGAGIDEHRDGPVITSIQGVGHHSRR